MAKDYYIPRNSPEAAKKIGAYNGDVWIIREQAYNDRELVRKQIAQKTTPMESIDGELQ